MVSTSLSTMCRGWVSSDSLFSGTGSTKLSTECLGQASSGR